MLASGQEKEQHNIYRHEFLTMISLSLSHDWNDKDDEPHIISIRLWLLFQLMEAGGCGGGSVA